jgi:hypothetical protein
MGCSMKLSAGDIIVAEGLADLMSNYGYAFIDGETVVALATSLCEFLRSEDVPTHPDSAEQNARRAGFFPLTS